MHRKSLFKQERLSCDRATQQTGCSFSWMDFFNGEENSAVTLCHFQPKLVTLAGCFLSPG